MQVPLIDGLPQAVKSFEIIVEVIVKEVICIKLLLWCNTDHKSVHNQSIHNYFNLEDLKIYIYTLKPKVKRPVTKGHVTEGCISLLMQCSM